MINFRIDVGLDHLTEMELIMAATALSDHLADCELMEKVRHEKDASVRDRFRAILWLQQVPEKWGKNLALVWDNAQVHKSAAKCLPDDVMVISLPPYSPELNPVERFFRSYGAT